MSNRATITKPAPADDAIAFAVCDEREPGDVLKPLAALLIELAERRTEQPKNESN